MVDTVYVLHLILVTANVWVQSGVLRLNLANRYIFFAPQNIYSFGDLNPLQFTNLHHSLFSDALGQCCSKEMYYEHICNFNFPSSYIKKVKTR